MRIDRYHFGHIDIAGRRYDADVIVFPHHIQENWWRMEGHNLALKDLESVFAEKPEKLVVVSYKNTKKGTLIARAASA